MLSVMGTRGCHVSSLGSMASFATQVFPRIRIGVKSEGSSRDAFARLLHGANGHIAPKLHIQVQLLNSPLVDANAANMRRSKTMATARAVNTLGPFRYGKSAIQTSTYSSIFCPPATPVKHYPVETEGAKASPVTGDRVQACRWRTPPFRSCLLGSAGWRGTHTQALRMTLAAS